MVFKGVFTALATPFRNNRLDEEAFRAFIEFQIAEGVHGLVPCGSTGESATLSHDEHERVIEICIDQARGRVPILAGAGSNNTEEAISLARFAKKAGADGALLITPYYNKPTQEGLYQHYKAIAQAVDLPLLPYNVPGRTSCNMLPPVVARLARDFANIVGIKEATANMAQGSEVIQSCPESFSVLSGDDFSALPLMAVGGKGVISTTSNVAPRAMSEMYNKFVAGDLAGAVAIHHSLYPLFNAMFYETNPIPVKTALGMMNLMTDELRLPLCPMSQANRERLADILRQQKLIS